MSLNRNYTYGLRQEGSFVSRASVTFEQRKGLFIVIRSEHGWSNYFGTSVSEKPMEYLTKRWDVPYNPDDKDWQTLNEIFSRSIPENRTTGHHYYDDVWKVRYCPSETDLFYGKRTYNRWT